MRNKKIQFVYNDGGRKEAGYKGSTGDCGVRAIAIATEKPYQEIYDLVNEICKDEKPSKRRQGKSSSGGGLHNYTFKKIMIGLGWKWTPTMFIGSGCKVHLKADELPSGRIICNLSRHYAAVVDGVLNDTAECSRNGTRCVYGYWTKENNYNYNGGEKR